MENETQQNNATNPVKQILAIICLIVMIVCGINAFRTFYKLKNPQGFYDIDAKNANIETLTSESTVYFKPVCAKCGHIHNSYRINMSAGEKYENVYLCEYCHEVFYVTIKKGK